MSRFGPFAAHRSQATQERLSRKHERDCVRQRVLDQNNKYFTGWDAQSKTLDHWEEIKGAKPPLASLPPYDCDERAFRRPAHSDTLPPEKLQKVHQDLKNTVRGLNELERDAVELKETSLQIISQVTSIRNKRREVTEALQSIESKRMKINSVRSARDRLVHQLFLVLDKIQVIESTVDHCSRLVDSQIYCPEEKKDLHSVLKSTENILRVMMSLNHSRNRDIASMYTEEADKCYDNLMMQWEEEDDMCWQVMLKVFETIESTLMEKLEANAELEEESLENRKSQVEQLMSYTSSLKVDQALWSQFDTNFFRSSFIDQPQERS